MSPITGAVPGSTKSRYIRISQHEDESQPPSPLSDAGTADVDLEDGAQNPIVFYDDEDSGANAREHSSLISHHFRFSNDSHDALIRPSQPQRRRWTRRKRASILSKWLGYGRRRNTIAGLEEKTPCRSCRKRRSPLSIVLRSLAIALMLL